jgi:hypothetical protein
MPEIGHLNGCSDWLELGVCGARADTAPTDESRYSITLSRSITIRPVSELEKLGVQRSPNTVHDRVIKPAYSPLTAPAQWERG